jgi:hypothetical protein
MAAWLSANPDDQAAGNEIRAIRLDPLQEMRLRTTINKLGE